MRKIVISLLLIAITILFVGQTIVRAEEVVKIKLTVNGKELVVVLEDNTSVDAFLEKLREGDITISARDYGSFEKVGSLGFTLPRNDKEITTKAGDIVLFGGDQISLYYDTNIWSLTLLGKVQNIDQEELKELLGKGNVTMVFSFFDEEEISNNIVSNEINNIVENNAINETINVVNNTVDESNTNNTVSAVLLEGRSNNTDTTTSTGSLPNVGERASIIVGSLAIVLLIIIVLYYVKK